MLYVISCIMAKRKISKSERFLTFHIFSLKLFCYEREEKGLLLLIVAGMVPVKLIKFFVVPSL